MATAFLAAMRSKDPVTQVGACIVNEDEKIVSVGYNGMPLGCHDDDFPWKKEAGDRSDTKHLYGEKPNSLSVILFLISIVYRYCILEYHFSLSCRA